MNTGSLRYLEYVDTVATVTVEKTAENHAARLPRPKYLFLDGIRGVSALYVVLHHCWQLISNEMPQYMRACLWWLAYGRFAVCAFIVLSGFCLMLPVAQRRGGYLEGGMLVYIGRRARRILPPYYAALALSLLSIVLCPAAFQESTPSIFTPIPAFDLGVIVSHLLVLHNLNPDWLFRINAPFWSVSTEWEIYFMFPLVLLPVWRKFGTVASVCVGVLCGIAVSKVSKNYHASFQFLGLFAFGMAAAVIAIRNSQAGYNGFRRWGVLAVLVFTSMCILGAWKQRMLLQDFMVGAITASLILYCAFTATKGSPASIVLRLFESKWALKLGLISYSLYLVHMPVLRVFKALSQSIDIPFVQHSMFMFVIGAFVSVGVGGLFYQAVEKHFAARSKER